ncbi:MAG: hypothetical protein FWC40_10080 [Proteobacteria bacterium]|nr:hypothetical protein [Pseudomonadota bacterium]
MMDRKEVKLLILFLAVAANSGCGGSDYALYGMPSILRCCGKEYKGGDPNLNSCLELEANNQCDVALCCGKTYSSKDDLDYMACIKEAADNGCPEVTLYGPPVDQQSE